MWAVAATGIALSVVARASEPTMRIALRIIKTMPCFITSAIATDTSTEKMYVFGVSDVGMYPEVGANRQSDGTLAMRQKHVAARTMPSTPGIEGE